MPKSLLQETNGGKSWILKAEHPITPSGEVSTAQDYSNKFYGQSRVAQPTIGEVKAPETQTNNAYKLSYPETLKPEEITKFASNQGMYAREVEARLEAGKISQGDLARAGIKIKRTDLKLMLQSSKEMANKPLLTFQDGKFVFNGPTVKMKIEPYALGINPEQFKNGDILNIEAVLKDKGLAPRVEFIKSLKTLKATKTEQDAVLNPIIDEISAIIKSNEQESNQSNGKSLTDTENSQAEGNQVVKTVNGKPTENIAKPGTAQSTSESKQSVINNRSQGSNTTPTQAIVKPAGNEPVQPAGTSTVNREVDKHAQYVEALSISKKLTDKPFETLSTHEKTVMKNQRDMAIQLHNTNPDLAMKVALGEANAPEGQLPEVIHNYEVSQAKDLETMIKLGNSPYNDTLSAKAQGLRASQEFKEPKSSSKNN